MDSYRPDSSNFTYYKNDPTDKYLINKFKSFNAFAVGFNVKVTRKKLSLIIEQQFGIESSRFRFKFPFPDPFYRVLNKKFYKTNIIGTYHLVKNLNSPYLIGGIMFSFAKINDYQSPKLSFYFSDESLDFKNKINEGDYHFNDVFYNDDASYQTKIILGIGKKIKKTDYSIRYTNLLSTKNLGKTHQIEFNISYYFLSSKDFTKSNYLYED